MQKFLPCLLGIFFVAFAHGQERFLPADFRQHGLTQYNSSLINFSFSENWDRPNSQPLWNRWWVLRKNWGQDLDIQVEGKWIRVFILRPHAESDVPYRSWY